MTTESTDPRSAPEGVPQEVMEACFERIGKLEDMLLAKDKDMPTHLQAIHASLIRYPEVVALLRDDEIHQIVKAAEEYVGQKIVAETAKGGGRKVGKVNLDMF